MRNFIYLLFIFIFLNTPALGESLSLIDCFKMARENHPLMKQATPIKEITEKEQKNLNTNYLPQLNLKLNASYQSDVTQLDLELPPTMPATFDIPTPDQDIYKTELEINQLIFDGGLTAVQKELASQDKKISLQKIKTDFTEIKKAITEAYYNLILLKKQANILDSWQADLTASHQLMKNLINNGVKEESDLYEIDIQRKELEKQIDENNQLINNVVSTLSELTGTPMTKDIRVYKPTITKKSLDFSNAQTRLFDYQLEKMELSKKMSFRNRLPKLVGFGKVGYGKPGLNMLNDEFDSYYMVGLTLEWNLWDWRKSHRNTQIIQYNQQILQLNNDAYDKNMRIQLRQKETAIKNLADAIKKDKEIFSLHKKIKKSAAAKLKNGVITTTDFLKYDNNYVRAELNIELHKIQLYKAKVNYLILKGEL